MTLRSRNEDRKALVEIGRGWGAQTCAEALQALLGSFAVEIAQTANGHVAATIYVARGPHVQERLDALQDEAYAAIRQFRMAWKGTTWAGEKPAATESSDPRDAHRSLRARLNQAKKKQRREQREPSDAPPRPATLSIAGGRMPAPDPTSEPVSKPYSDPFIERWPDDSDTRALWKHKLDVIECGTRNWYLTADRNGRTAGGSAARKSADFYHISYEDLQFLVSTSKIVEISGDLLCLKPEVSWTPPKGSAKWRARSRPRPADAF